MKNTILKLSFALLLITSVFVTSCKKGDENGNNSRITDEELPGLLINAGSINEDDTKSGGIYKAVLVGSSGSVKLALVGGLRGAYVTFENQTKALRTTDLDSWTSGQAVNNASFKSGDWTLLFSVNADGSNPRLTVTIPGHNVTVIILKEKVNTPVVTYEGTFSSNGGGGVFNFVTQGTTGIKGLLKTTDNIIIPFTGTVTNNNISVTANNTNSVINAAGAFTNNGANANGTFTDKNANFEVQGTWVAKKIL